MTPLSPDYWTGAFAFVRAARAGSFTGAAKLLGVTPSAVSRALARFEAQLGATLILRSTRALTLTAEGEQLLERIEPLLEGLADAGAEIGKGRPPTGTVRIGASVDLGRVLVARWVASLAQAFSGIAVELVVTDRLVDLKREGIDLSVRIGPSVDADARYRRIAAAGYALVASPAYVQRAGFPSSPEELQDHACLQYLANDGAPLEWSLDGKTFRTTGPFATDDAGALLAAARGGAGIAYMLRFAVEESLADGTLVEILPGVRTPRLSIGIAHAYGARCPARVAVVEAFLINAIVAAIPEAADLR